MMNCSHSVNFIFFQLVPFHYKSSSELTLIITQQESILGCYEFSSANRINLKLFTLASDRLFELEENEAIFHKISQEQEATYEYSSLR